jgi:ammonium transporter, Amt family
LLTLV